MIHMNGDEGKFLNYSNRFFCYVNINLGLVSTMLLFSLDFSYSTFPTNLIIVT